MAASDAAHPAQGALVAREKSKLRKVLRRFDLVLFTVITLLWPGAINALFGQSYSIESSWGVSRVFFESVTLGSFAVVIALGLVFWALGERKRRAGLLGIDVKVDGTRPGK